MPGVAAAAVGTALVLRLGGVGSSWLPSAGRLGLGLALLAIATHVWRSRPPAEWPALVRRHAFAISLGLAVAAAIAVRLPGLTSDLGHVPIDIDENRLAANVGHFFATGELRHDTVEHYPGAVFWLFAAASFLGYLRELVGGLAPGPTRLPVELFVQSARLANVGVGAAIVAVTGLLGRRLFGPGAGLIAALVLAVVPLSVDTTSLVRNDPGMVLAMTAAVYLAVVSLDDPGRDRWVIASGALAGVATGIKYSSVFALLPAMIAAASAGTGRDRARRTALAVTGFAAAVALTNHFIWADFPTFLQQLANQIAITGRGHWAATDNPAAFYVMILDRFGPGWPLLWLSAAFAVFALSTARIRYLLFLAFPLLYLWFMTQRPSQFPRWVFPMVPFVAVAGAGVLAAIARLPGLAPFQSSSLSGRVARLAATLLVGAALWPPASAGAVAFSRHVTTPTHTLVEAFLLSHAPPGQVVVLENHWLDLRDVPVVVNRVPDLARFLDAGLEGFGGVDWIVVPEPNFGHPALKRLGLVRRFHAGQSFGGNVGYDYEVYGVPRLPPTTGSR
jgi:4-amino-4-deoxy-L-arabinose transferase-like glycosyltransferase